MLVACRLAGLSAHEGHYAGVRVCGQSLVVMARAAAGSLPAASGHGDAGALDGRLLPHPSLMMT
jgi:hypothetical protein